MVGALRSDPVMSHKEDGLAPKAVAMCTWSLWLLEADVYPTSTHDGSDALLVPYSSSIVAGFFLMNNCLIPADSKQKRQRLGLGCFI